MLFVTNRVLNEGPTPRNPTDGSFILPRSISFNLKNNQAEQSVYFCRRNAQGNYTEIGSLAFFNELKTLNVQQVVLFLHGFSTLPEGAMATAADLQVLFDQKAQGEIAVVPLIWPCDNDTGIVKDYFDDQLAADASGIAFMRMFEKFLTWRDYNSTLDNPCTKWINLLAHSMGNRVMRGAIRSSVQYFQPRGFPLIFRNVFMAAADVSNNTLEPGQDGESIPQSARNVVSYYAADDLAMRASKVANTNVASPRLGQTGPARMDKVPKNVYALDCADFNNDYDPPTGHGYFRRDPQGNPGLVFNHMWACIETGRVPVRLLDARTRLVRDVILEPLEGPSET
jgi:esterase/lipase superfamily enzyme